MGYSLPVNFVKISRQRNDGVGQFDSAVCITRIVAMMSTKIYQARKTITAERKAGTLINAAGVEKVKTAIFLDNGSVIASPLSVNTLLNAIERANIKANPNITRTMKVYDVPHGAEDPDDEPEDELEDDDEDYEDDYEEEEDLDE